MGEHYTDTDIAIIGMAGRFPGAADVDRFWANLRAGVEGISDLDDAALDAAGVPAALRDDPAYVKRAPLVAGIDMFDAEHWGFSPREADILDPQQRIFLECAWEAIERAGYVPRRIPGRVGVFAGAGVNTYLLSNLLPNRALVESVGEYALMLASDKDYLATRTAFKLDLRGPCVTVQTACSTALVAVHLAVQSLLSGESDMALAGGANLRVPQAQGYIHSPGMIHSSDGHCRPFDAAADGTVGGSGAGVVLLRRLQDAQEAGDHIIAVIKGSAVNNDGARKVGYTAPSVQGQAQVIAEAQAVGDIDPDTISYVEAHGTATTLGDPIEIAALTRAFRRSSSDTGFCAIGSIKSNIGHLDAAAGIAGLMKTALALQHRELPPSLHFHTPNPQIDFASSPFYVQDRAAPWTPRAGVRRAGVSSFGIGGTNAHVVLAEAPPRPPAQPGWPWQLLPLSARSPAALDASCERLAQHLEDHPGEPLADIACTLQQGRTSFDERQVVVCRDHAQAIAALRGQGERVDRGRPSTDEARVAFLFSGQGAQYPGMGRDLYAVAPVFRHWVDECAARLAPLLDRDIRELVFADDSAAARAALNDTATTQPALFVIEYALAQQWMAWGIRPALLIGHSIGEYTAACLAEVFSLDAALALVAERGRLMGSLPGGAMMSVAAAATRVIERLPAGIDLAAVNAPELCVVAGSAEALRDLGARLADEGIASQPLHVSHAFHSAHMDPVLGPFAERIGRATRSAPRIPLVSNVTGTWLSDDEAMDPGYWARHVRATVRFAAGLDTIITEAPTALLEIGPGRVLGTLARARARDHAALVLRSLPSAKEPEEGLSTMLQSLGRLWIHGSDVDWQALHTPASRRRVPLPTYPFERRRHWIEADASALAHSGHSGRLPQSRWLSRLSWDGLADASADARADARRDTRADAEPHQSAIWILCASSEALAQALRDALNRTLDSDVDRAAPASGRHTAIIDPAALHDPATWQRLPLGEAAQVHLVHIPNTAAEHAWAAGAGDLLQAVPRMLAALSGAALTVNVMAAGSLALGPGEPLSVAHAAARGALTVLGQELPELRTRWIDIDLHHPAWAQAAAAELVHGRVPVVALRGYQRFAPRYEPVALPTPVTPPFRDHGVYLITGGTGGIGRALALHLARTYRARLALLARGADAQSPDGHALVAAIEAAGGQAMLLGADITHAQALDQALAAAHDRWDRFDGVIHGAGVAGDAALLPCADTTTEAWDRIARVKEHGTQVLAEALASYQPPWVLVMSSLATVLGGLGMAAYASANIAQDALVHQLGQHSATRWYSIAWDGWAPPPAPAPDAAQSHDDTTIRADEGIAVIERVLGQRGHGHVIVSVSDLEERRQQWIVRAWEDAADSSPQAERPQLHTEYAAPRNTIETRLADIWSELLGIAQIGIHDNFFDLGGHSLLATQLAARIRAAFHVDMQLRTLFDTPTVAALAQHLAPAALAQRVQAPLDDDDEEREEIEL